MKLPFFLAFLALFEVALAHSFYFLPKQNKEAEDALLKAIAEAKSTIDIALYSFTHKDLAKALRQASKRGVVVTLILDTSQNADNPQSALTTLAKLYRVKVCLLSGLKSKRYNRYTQQYIGLMHNKMMIIDKTLLFTGSANWSTNSFHNNYETILVDDDPHILQHANDAFKDMTQKCPGFL
ncbi:phospholipase D-like domain-containing protein [Helicobacter salomonis]|uniref:phospholipase D-like domain-containing protein n=1 Tax=Helicobacter salomonis TaxID=56878 RepID=UPI000CF06DC4|nr:phospholipase D-like domain-containing protein [Helicobacter salomonis]